MLSKLVLSMSLLFYLSCATANKVTNTSPPDNPKPTVDITAVISLLYPSGNAAHACPCENKIYTARHVVQHRSEGGYLPQYNAFSWADQRGNSGYAIGTGHNIYQDLGSIALREDNKSYNLDFYYKKASKLPEKDEKVYWVEFDSKGFRSIKKEAKVAYYFAGHIFTNTLPTPGASGSCMFNEDGEVIGILVWGVRKGSSTGSVGVLLID